MHQELLSLDCQNFLHYNSSVFLPILETLLVQGFIFERDLQLSKLFKNTICISVCTLKGTERRFINFTPSQFSPLVFPHTEFKGSPEYACVGFLSGIFSPDRDDF